MPLTLSYMPQAKVNKTFATRFLNFTTTYTAVADKEIDFIYTNPSVYSCLENEFGVRAIVSIVQLRQTGTRERIPLSQFGGTFFTRSTRSDLVCPSAPTPLIPLQSVRCPAHPIHSRGPRPSDTAPPRSAAMPQNDIADIGGQRLEGVDVVGLGAGQAQWRELYYRGLSFWNFPKQLIFSKDQTRIVFDILSGAADIGMVRTDLIEGLAGQGRINYSDFKCAFAQPLCLQGAPLSLMNVVVSALCAVRVHAFHCAQGHTAPPPTSGNPLPLSVCMLSISLKLTPRTHYPHPN